MSYKPNLFVALVSALLAQGAFAAVTAEEAKQLNGDKLTAIGSEKAGNKEGTIPPYSGKPPKMPASYSTNDPGQRPDPYNDKPLFSITAQNAEQYADKLDGMRELFKRFPEYRMDVYPTHRDWAYPQYVLDNGIKNAVACKAVAKELKLEGCYGGIPFPIPKTGNEVMWNHLTQFESHTLRGRTSSTLTPADGKYVLTARSDNVQRFPYYDPKNAGPNPTDQTYWQIAVVTSAPPRDAGAIIVILDNLDQVDKGRRAYQYIPGQRRVKLSPNLAYDTPNPQTGGTSTMDDARVFLGALDRFDWKLIGKKEKFIVYNAYNTANNKACDTDKFANHKHFPNPECIRWELHRVWQVEGTLKPGLRHIYQKRVFYWDEDAPGVGIGENYDASGKLYRVASSMAYPFYEGQLGGYADGTFVMDLQTGAWTTNGLGSFATDGWYAVPPLDDRAFSPDALAGQAVR